jgi:hypothetical protein
LLLALCASSVAENLRAQAADSTRQVPPDSARHDLKPMQAFFQSLLIPGWSQARLDRKLTATIFVGWEGVTLGMALKAADELRYLRRIGADSVRIDGKSREKQDWLVLLAFNHLFSGLEAYVGSQLQDFPADVRIRAAPRGIGFEASVPFRIR